MSRQPSSPDRIDRTDNEDAVPSASKPFLEHLEDLRRALVGAAGALLVGMLIVAPFTPRIFALLKAPLAKATGQAEPFLRTIDVGGAFSLTMRIIFWGGLLVSAPVIVILVAWFVFPGLSRREQRAVKRSAGFAALLFAGGVTLGYAITLPVALQVMLGMNRWLGLRPEWVVTSYVAFALQLLLAFGLVFELPVVLLVLGRLGIVRSRVLREKRRHVIVVLLVVAMILTPPDIFTQMFMAVPLILLYEMCIWLIRAMERERSP